ncbi:unnamed protein product [Candida verbasci]|uniref:DM2 domain-containing protein n=1 Tax=Candida verbasci TaxID=1227364 RepID=A0A9W4X871_9ASCO|nr:unnamed protein product [Candida verbasci]
MRIIRNFSTLPKYKVSKKLSSIIGNDIPIMTKQQIMNRFWNYVEAKKLDGWVSVRYIRCDDNLKAVLNQEAINCGTDLEKMLNGHLIEVKLDAKKK